MKKRNLPSSNKEEPTRANFKRPMTEYQKVDWMYYALGDLIVNSLDYNRDRMCARLAKLTDGIRRIKEERETKPGVFVNAQYKARHDKVVQHLASCVSQLTDAWQWTMKMRNSENCDCIRTAQNLLGELIKEELLYTELPEEEEQ